MALLQAIENSAFCTWVREDNSLWAYPGILFVHAAAMATLVGISAMIALRAIGFARKLPVAPFDRFFPIVWAAFWLSAISGATLLAADATALLANRVFALKILLVGLAVADMLALRRVVFRHPRPEDVAPLGRVLAAASLVLWFAAVAAGKLAMRG